VSGVILITGGAGFVGSNLAVWLAKRHPDLEIVALDNLHRRGSELNTPRLERAGVRFVRGDVREPADLEGLPPVDALIECSAEPAATSGADGETSFVFQTNVTGAYNCLELARRDGAFLVFLSTSRVYPVGALNGVAYEEAETRLELSAKQRLPGVSLNGISEDFPLAGSRTLYGATKLAAELLIEEYREMFGLRAVVNRSGVIAGPWQMGKQDQGVFAFWLLAHHFGLPLSYFGYGGGGKQVRDMLHVRDLAELISEQLEEPGRWDGHTLNVGGGRDHSLSLAETTELCRQLTGTDFQVGSEPEARARDVPIYISDCGRLQAMTDWRPKLSPSETLRETSEWIAAHKSAIGEALALDTRARG
jgi:CDP-paratose 2-epimerase